MRALTLNAFDAGLTLSELPVPEPLAGAGGAGGRLMGLPRRAGPGPRTTPWAPHIQLDQHAPPEMQAALAARVFALPEVEERAGTVADPRERAIWLRDEIPVGPADAFLGNREVGHIHPWDGSLHIALPPAHRNDFPRYETVGRLGRPPVPGRSSARPAGRARLPRLRRAAGAPPRSARNRGGGQGEILRNGRTPPPPLRAAPPEFRIK